KLSKKDKEAVRKGKLKLKPALAKVRAAKGERGQHKKPRAGKSSPRNKKATLQSSESLTAGNRQWKVLEEYTQVLGNLAVFVAAEGEDRSPLDNVICALEHTLRFVKHMREHGPKETRQPPPGPKNNSPKSNRLTPPKDDHTWSPSDN